MNKQETTTDEILSILRPAVVSCVQGLLKEVGIQATKEESENLISNLGMYIYIQKLKAEKNQPTQ